jgi:general secretion pathway protein E
MDCEDLKEYGIHLKGKKVQLHHGKGCIRCRQTGYRGRKAVFEVLPYTEALREMTTADVNIESIRRKAKEEGMVSLRENAIRKMIEGITTYQEVLRVTS